MILSTLVLPNKARSKGIRVKWEIRKKIFRDMTLFDEIDNIILIFYFTEMGRYLTIIALLFTPASLALELPRWSDVFSSLEPYKDPETLLLEEEDGEARLGFVQV